jgi:transcriptional regulator with XRE-family HTH domain
LDDCATVAGRIKELKGLRSKAAVERELGYAPDGLRNHQKRGILPLQSLVDFARREGVDLRWLLTGRSAVNDADAWHLTEQEEEFISALRKLDQEGKQRLFERKVQDKTASTQVERFCVVLQRVKDLKGLRFNTEVAHLLNMTPHALQGRKEDGRLPLPQLAQFAADEGVDLFWLLTGERPVKRQQSTPENLLELREWLQGQAVELDGRGGEPEPAGRDPASFDAVMQRIQDLKGLGSQAAVARLLGMSKQNLHQLRTTGSLPIDRLVRLADEEGVTLRWLLCGADEETDALKDEITEVLRRAAARLLGETRLSGREQEFVDQFRELDEGQQEAALQFIEGLRGKRG